MATYQQWSQSYFSDLTLAEHDVNYLKLNWRLD